MNYVEAYFVATNVINLHTEAFYDMYIREKCSPFTQYSMKCRGSFTNAEYSKHFVLCRVGWQECGLFFLEQNSERTHFT